MKKLIAPLALGLATLSLAPQAQAACDIDTAFGVVGQFWYSRYDAGSCPEHPGALWEPERFAGLTGLKFKLYHNGWSTKVRTMNVRRQNNINWHWQVAPPFADSGYTMKMYYLKPGNSYQWVDTDSGLSAFIGGH